MAAIELDPERLVKAFGFKPAKSFVDFIEIIYSVSNGNDEDFLRIVDDAFFFRPSAELSRAVGLKPLTECRYNQTPLELIPFGDHGVDGAHIGFILLAPELKMKELPIGVLNPSDFEGVMLAGDTFKFALERRIGELIQDFDNESCDEKKGQYELLIRRICSALKLKPKPCMNDMGWSTQQPIVIMPPKGYIYLPTDDGLGALFSDKTGTRKVDEPSEDVDEAMSEAQKAVKSRRFGNALYYLRQAAWANCTDDEARCTIAREMVGVYESLNRPLLAGLAQRRADGEF